MTEPTTAVATAAPAAPSQPGRALTPFEAELDSYAPQIRAALPAHIPLDRFKRVVLTAINTNPDLYKADRRSLFLASVRAAQDGLLPDGQEAALVTFGKLVQYMPMVKGVLKRMRNSGEVASASAYVVFQNDHFHYTLGDDPKIDHKPSLGERGKPIGAYAIIKLTNGEVLREVMSYGEIEKVRAVSRAKSNGPWMTWWEEMARKTVLRRCAKRAPTSADLDEVMRREDEWVNRETGRPEPIDVTERPSREDPQLAGPSFDLYDDTATLVQMYTSAESYRDNFLEFLADPATDYVALGEANQETIKTLPADMQQALRDAYIARHKAAEKKPNGSAAQAEQANGSPVAAEPADPVKRSAADWQTWRGDVIKTFGACETEDELAMAKEAADKEMAEGGATDFTINKIRLAYDGRVSEIKAKAAA